jgi:hypothetical protein
VLTRDFGGYRYEAVTSEPAEYVSRFAILLLQDVPKMYRHLRIVEGPLGQAVTVSVVVVNNEVRMNSSVKPRIIEDATVIA